MNAHRPRRRPGTTRTGHRTAGAHTGDAGGLPRVVTFFLLFAASLAPGLVAAQDVAPAPAAQEAGEDAEDPSRETDISEDNYRRFMELDDRRLERPAFPAAALQPGSQLQKMGQLPESSQKHLRNQLRGIILARGDWTPEELNRDYPFVPSEQARGDSQLLRDEMEAWAELVTEYHEREAAIYAAETGRALPGDPGGDGQDPGRRQAAGNADARTAGDGQAGAKDGDGNGEPGAAGQAGGSDGAETTGDGSDAGGAAERSASTPREPRRPLPSAETTSAVPPSSTMSTEGVEQSASAYLRAQGYESSSVPNGDTTPGTENGGRPADPGRWGAASQTLPPPVPAAAVAPDAPAEAPLTPPPLNTLTLDELRGVRGVNEPVDVGNPFGALPAMSPEPTAGGRGSVREPSDSEEDSGSGDERDDDSQGGSN